MADPNDAVNSATAFENVERNYQAIIQEMNSQNSLERFRMEFERLHRALKKSNESEKRLILKCQELTQEVVAGGAKIQSTLKLSQSDQTTIEALEKEIEKTWKMVDMARDKETKGKETIEQLKKEATNLQQLVEQGTQLTRGHEAAYSQLMNEKLVIITEQDFFLSKMDVLNKDIKTSQETCNKFEIDLIAQQEKKEQLVDKLSNIKRDYDKEVINTNKSANHEKELLSVLAVRGNEIAMRNQAVQQIDAVMSKLKLELDDTSENSQKQAEYLKRLTENLAETKRTHDDFSSSLHYLMTSIKDYEDQEEQRDREILKALLEEQRVMKLKNMKAKQILDTIQAKEDAQRRLEELQNQESSCGKEVEMLDRAREKVQKKMSNEDEQYKSLAHVVEASKTKQSLINEEINTEKSRQTELTTELDRETALNFRLRHQVSELKTTREHLSEEASNANLKYLQIAEEIKVGLVKIDDLSKQIEDTEKLLSEKHKMYEQVRIDRNNYSKKLVEYQDENCELKQKFKIMDHRICQLQEELDMKVKKYAQEQQRKKEKSEQLLKLRAQENDTVSKFEAAKQRSAYLNHEIAQLTKVINKCDVKLSAQHQKFLTVTNERDILGTQLIRRNDELALLYEKLRLQQQTANDGELKYRARLKDIRMLKLKISELTRNNTLAAKRAQEAEAMRRKASSLLRQLTLERTKVQSLSEALEDPYNNMRWRKLEGNDPSEQVLIQKIQTLQKRLISKAETSVENDIILAEMDKLYIELRAILARQPGPEVVEQLTAYQTELRQKNAAMKAIAGELNMTMSRISESKYETNRIARELEDTKRIYFDMKTSNQLYLSKAKQKCTTNPTDLNERCEEARAANTGKLQQLQQDAAAPTVDAEGEKAAPVVMGNGK